MSVTVCRLGFSISVYIVTLNSNPSDVECSDGITDQLVHYSPCTILYICNHYIISDKSEYLPQETRATELFKGRCWNPQS